MQVVDDRTTAVEAEHDDLLTLDVKELSITRDEVPGPVMRDADASIMTIVAYTWIT